MTAQPPPKPQNQDKTLRLFIWLSVISILIPILIYLYRKGSWIISDKKEDWDLLSAYIGGTLGPIVGVLSLLISGYIVHKFNIIQQKYQEDKDNGQLQQVTIDLFKEFRSEQMSKARSCAWAMKIQWYGDDEVLKERFRRLLVIAMVSENPSYDLEISIERQHLRAVNDMISFYTMLSLYSKNGKNIKELNYFYYPWWRGFLRELTEKVDQQNQACLQDDPELNAEGFNKVEYFDNLSHSSAFERLDKICGFEGLKNFDMMCGVTKLTFSIDPESENQNTLPKPRSFIK